MVQGLSRNIHGTVLTHSACMSQKNVSHRATKRKQKNFVVVSFITNIEIFFDTAFHAVAYEPNVFHFIINYTFDIEIHMVSYSARRRFQNRLRMTIRRNKALGKSLHCDIILVLSVKSKSDSVSIWYHFPKDRNTFVLWGMVSGADLDKVKALHICVRAEIDLDLSVPLPTHVPFLTVGISF